MSSSSLLSPLPTRLIELMPGAALIASTHKYYTADGVEMLSSVTARIDADIMCEKFDSVRMPAAVFSLCERMRADPHAPWNDEQRLRFKRWGHCRSAEETARAWEDNRDNGTYTHQTIEFLVRGICTLREHRANTPEALQFRSLYDWMVRVKKWEIIAVEAVLVMPEISTGGCVDAVVHDTQDPDPDNVILLDWKTMAPVVFEPGARHCNYFALPRCKRSKQEIQMNMYASMTEAQTKKRVKEMRVVYFDVEAGFWDCVIVERRREETEAYLAALAAVGGRPPSPELLVAADKVKRLRVR
jgi:hypothetical protein